MSENDRGRTPGSGGMSEGERAAFEKRAAEIGQKLGQAKGRHPTQTEGERTAQSDRGKAMGRALRISTELVGGIVVGSAIGYGLDRWLGTEKPWFFIVFFMLGAAAGMLNVIRSAAQGKTP